jgi:hypothetical protein
MGPAALLLLFVIASGCTPQMTASLMPMRSMGTSMSSQAANLYFENERMKQQAEPQRQQQMLRNQSQSGYLP